MNRMFAILAFTLLGLATQAQAQGQTASNNDRARQALEQIMNTANTMGTETGEDVPPVPEELVTPAAPPVESDNDPELEWPAGIERADPKRDPLGSKLDEILIGGRNLRKEVRGLRTKVEIAITRVDEMAGRQTKTIASLEVFEARQAKNAAKIVTVQTELTATSQKLGVAEQRQAAAEQKTRELQGAANNLAWQVQNAQGQVAALNRQLDRPRLTNLFGLLGTR